MEIKVEKIDKTQLEKLGIFRWPIWEKEESSFDWYYDNEERCYFIEGEVEVETDDAKQVAINKGDYVIFPKGLKCTWNIKKRVRKHYKFGE
ncbi:MAG: cupin domain-containing protein [Candidatus Omnitrophica bacterium]|nr:cupin domain-containing protein [Candidatus Omnitrophota bacterium]